jgi:XTP/dITP diphosphohydrolase
VAEDSGLEIDALGGAPASSPRALAAPVPRIQTEFALIYRALRAKGAVEGPARFACADVRDVRRILFRASAPSKVVSRRRQGDGGFGYDPIFTIRHAGRRSPKPATSSLRSATAEAFGKLRGLSAGVHV